MRRSSAAGLYFEKKCLWRFIMECVLLEETKEVRTFKITANTEAEFKLLNSLAGFISGISGGLRQTKPVDLVHESEREFRASHRLRSDHV